MRTRLLPGLTLLVAFASLVHADDERTKAIAQQKKAAEDAWKAMDVGEASHLETKHLLVYGPRMLRPRLEAIGTRLEKYHELAVKALAINLKEDYTGKITVYLFDSKEQIPAFARRVEKRRPMSGETASFSAEDDQLHAAAAPSTNKLAPPVEARAGEMIAALLVQRKAKVRTPLPEWLMQGFGRATSYRVYGPTVRFVVEERKQARTLARKKNASDVWGGTLEASEAEPLQASLAEFLSYGLGSARFVKLLVGFQPGENMDSKTTAQALEAAGLEGERINKGWKAYVK